MARRISSRPCRPSFAIPQHQNSWFARPPAGTPSPISRSRVRGGRWMLYGDVRRAQAITPRRTFRQHHRGILPQTSNPGRDELEQDDRPASIDGAPQTTQHMMIPALCVDEHDVGRAITDDSVGRTHRDIDRIQPMTAAIGVMVVVVSAEERHEPWIRLRGEDSAAGTDEARHPAGEVSTLAPMLRHVPQRGTCVFNQSSSSGCHTPASRMHAAMTRSVAGNSRGPRPVATTRCTPASQSAIGSSFARCSGTSANTACRSLGRCPSLRNHRFGPRMRSALISGNNAA
jgi:hypothetical protein